MVLYLKKIEFMFQCQIETNKIILISFAFCKWKNLQADSGVFFCWIVLYNKVSEIVSQEWDE